MASYNPFRHEKQIGSWEMSEFHLDFVLFGNTFSHIQTHMNEAACVVTMETDNITSTLTEL